MLFLIESIILCVIFTVIIIPVTLKNPLQQLHNYPPRIQERVKSLHKYQGRIQPKKKSLSMQITSAIIAVLLLALVSYFSGVRSFAKAYLYIFGLWMVVNCFDTFVLDIVWFCHDKRFRIPGTQDMIKDYESPWFHIIGGMKGTLIGAVVSAFAATLTWLIVNFIS